MARTKQTARVDFNARKRAARLALVQGPDGGGKAGGKKGKKRVVAKAKQTLKTKKAR